MLVVGNSVIVFTEIYNIKIILSPITSVYSEFIKMRYIYYI